MTYQHILFELEARVATITFNRPKALNALNSELLSEFGRALDEIAVDEDIRVLILTGSGEKAFVAGADISELATMNALQGKQFAEKGHSAIGRLQKLSIPVIAAVNGFALGGGSEIALACDFIYASEDAKFGLPEIFCHLTKVRRRSSREARLGSRPCSPVRPLGDAPRARYKR